MKRYIIGIDEGTTSARVGIYDVLRRQMKIIVQKPISVFYPKPTYVEQDANEIWNVVSSCISEAMQKANVRAKNVISIGITNQRETVVAWDKKTGKALANTICWQCRRTAKEIENLPKEIKSKIKKKTGLIPDAYFSATKFKWLLENNKSVKKAYKNNSLMLGNIDSFLAYKLTGNFITDTTNASRTMLYNIHTNKWDDYLLRYFNIDSSLLPKVISCNEIVGETIIDGEKISVCGILGDQQSALFGQCCFDKGMAKNTYGTGSFLLVNIGDKPKLIPNLLTDIAYTINGKTTYAIEGSVFNCGSTINFLKDNLKLFENSKQTQEMAKSVNNTNGVVFIPAFTGMAAPHWNSNVTASIVGMTRGVTKEHIVRAALESIAYRTEDILALIRKHFSLSEIRCDGGVSRNNFVMQFQSDISRVKLVLPTDFESTLLGVIFMSGLGMKIYKDLNEIASYWKDSTIFTPKMNINESNKKLKLWKLALNNVLK